MKTMKILMALAFLAASGPALAQLQTRCFTDDWITTAGGGQGRNAWSVKCGYISQARADYLNAFAEYEVYIEGCSMYPDVPAGSSCTRFVPSDPNAACVTGLTKLGSCVVGCYTPTQKLMFGGAFVGIEAAYQAGTSTVTALSPLSTTSELRFAEQPIQSFVAGDTKEEIWVLQTADGRKLEVTSEHPMVNAAGTMVRAKTLKAGDALLGADGLPVVLSDVTVRFFEGKVWNVRPVTSDKLENVLDAEGLLTGSVRFQNEWANDDYRLNLRDEADVSGL